MENTGLFCDARTVTETDIEQVLVRAINKLLCEKDAFLTILMNNIETILKHGNDKIISEIDERLQILQTELLRLSRSKVDYEDVAEEIYRLRDKKQNLQIENSGSDELQKRISEMVDFLNGQPTAIAEYDELLVRRLIENVKVHEEKFTVEFKSGVLVDFVE